MSRRSANIEIKARCRDLAGARETVARLATRHLGVDHQVDTYFATRAGRLKLRESSLSGAQLVPYLRPDQEGPKRSDYQLIPVTACTEVKRLLGEVLGIHCVVVKEREIFLHDNVRIHLDRVEGLGDFIELEAVFDGDVSRESEQHDKVLILMGELAIEASQLVDVSYETLLTREALEARR